MIQPCNKSKAPTIMVWGAFLGTKRSNLIRMRRDEESRARGYTAASYLGVLEDQILTIWEPGLVFMQDNARVHTA